MRFLFEKALKPKKRSNSGRGVHARGRSAMRRERFVGTDEPYLSEILADDVLHRLMKRDGVQMDGLLSVINDARTRL